MNKFQLKKLIKEVIRETRMNEARPDWLKGSDKEEKPKSTSDITKHSREHEKEYGKLGDTTITFGLRGVNRNNLHVVRDFLAQAAHAAKMADLDLIHAEIEKQGKNVDAFEAGELKALADKAEKEEWEKFNTTATKSVTDKKSKEKPKLGGEPKSDVSTDDDETASPEWKGMTKRDLAFDRTKTAIKNAMDAKDYDRARQLYKGLKAKGIDINVDDPTSLWSDKDWEKWDRENPEPKGKKRVPDFKFGA